MFSQMRNKKKQTKLRHVTFHLDKHDENKLKHSNICGDDISTTLRSATVSNFREFMTFHG